MVVVTHEMGFARKAANRVVFMADGQIVEENDPEAFFTAPAVRPRQGLPRQDPDALTGTDSLTAPTRTDCTTGTHQRSGQHTRRKHMKVRQIGRGRRRIGARARPRPRVATAPRTVAAAAEAEAAVQGRHQVRPARPRPEGGLEVHRLRRRRRDLRRQGARPRRPATSSWSRRPSRPARDAHLDRAGRHGRRDLLDHRHAQGRRSPSPARTSSPARTCSSAPTTPPSPARRPSPARSSARSQGSTSAQKVKDKYPGVQLQEFGTYSECVAALVSKGVDALTTDNTILAGYAAQAQYKGKLKVVGKTFSEERYGIGIKKGDKATCEKINTAIAQDDLLRRRGRRPSTPTSARPGSRSTPRPTRPSRTPAPDRPTPLRYAARSAERAAYRGVLRPTPRNGRFPAWVTS